MKKMKTLIAVVVATAVLGTAGAAFAAAQTPADIAAAVTGKSTEDVIKQRADGKTYGTIAKEAGKLDEFKAKMLEQKKAILDERVKAGTLTQAQADAIYNSIKERMTSCDGTGTGNGGNCGSGNCGAGLGKGNGMGRGNGMGNGMGMGRGAGMGNCQIGAATR